MDELERVLCWMVIEASYTAMWPERIMPMAAFGAFADRWLMKRQCGDPWPRGGIWCDLENGHSGQHRCVYLHWGAKKSTPP